MLSTIVLLGSLLVLSIVSALVWALLLKLGLYWAGVPGGTMRRTAVVSVVITGFQLVVLVVLAFALYVLPAPSMVTRCLAFVAGALVLFGSWWGIAKAFHAPLLRAVLAWLPTLLSSAVTYPLTHYVFVPYVYEAFRAGASSMAPTLVSEHFVDKCPECGAPCFATVPEDDGYGRPEPLKMVCTKFHSHKFKEYDHKVYPADRFLAAKFLAPRRWDMIVFRNPDDEEQNYVKRLIGLPGETVTLVDGAAFINGVKLEPPEELRGITYVTEFADFPGPDVWGSPQKPAVLGPDEYFVLGDNTNMSLDSRLWQRGVSGHPPYAVPQSHFIGVVTHCYWPPERLRIFR